MLFQYIKYAILSSILVSYTAAQLYTKKCTETIDLGFSSYIIDHRVYGLTAVDEVLTIGNGYHTLGIMQPEIVVRLYNCSFVSFPPFIYRNAYDPESVAIDKYLTYELIEKK